MITDLELMHILKEEFEECEYYENKYFYVVYQTITWEVLGLCDFAFDLMLDSNQFELILNKYKHLTQYPNFPFKFDIIDKGNGHPKQLRLDWINKVIKILEDEEHNRR